MALCLAVAASPPGHAQTETDADARPKKNAKLPLESSDDLRNFSLTVDRVTWLSIDVSPDGEELVMEVLGDLYSLPVAGGEAEPLSVGMAFESQPAYSPDGEWIAYLSDRSGAENLWIRPRDPEGGEPRQLSRDDSAAYASPTWTAGGEYVLVSRSPKGFGTFELWMYHREGGKGVQVTDSKPEPDTPRSQRLNALGAVASPDGRFLYYARRSGGFEYNADFPLWQIVRRDLEHGDDDILTTSPGSAMRPRLSPDGRVLVYATRRDNQTGLKARNLESGEERWLAYPVQRDEQESRATRDLYPGYAFTPDGRALVVSWDGRLHRLELANGAQSEIPFTVQIEKKIGPKLVRELEADDGAVQARIVQGAELSPDGGSIAFSALTRLYLREADGSTRLLSPDGLTAYQPTWSPDGAHIAYVSWAREGGHVYRVAAAGGPPIRLTATPAYYAQPAWSPDGERLVVLRGTRQQRLEMPAEFGSSPLPLDLVWLDPELEGGETRLIAPSRGVGRPHFGPEADRVYVYSNRGLQSMRYDGSDRRVHLQVKGPGLYAAEEPVPASEVQISPDGHWALTQVSNRFFLVAVPRTGKAPEVNIDAPAVPTRKLTPLGADTIAWADAGETVTWTLGSTFHRLARASIELWKESDDTESAGPSEGAGGDHDDQAQESEETFPAAQEIVLRAELPRDRPGGTLALTGARLITLRGDEVVESGDIVVENGRIRSLGSSGTVEIPAGAQVLDAAGKTIVPGFVDTHAHWLEIRRGVLDTEGWMFLANLAWGVTAGLDVQTGSNDTFAYQDLIDAGEMLGPRAFSTGPGVFSNNAFESRAQATGILRRYRDHYRTHNIKAYISGNRKQRQWIVQASHELGMMPTTEGALDLELDLTHALDGFAGNEHSLPVTPLFDDTVQLFARSGIGYTPTLLVSYGGPWAENAFYTTSEVHDRAKVRHFLPHEIIDQKTRKRPWFREGEHIYPRLAAEAAKIVRAGGRVGVGSHGQLQGLGFHWELWALASGGLSPLEALRCATLHGAEIIGRGRELGSLEPGKLADLLVLERNPLDDIRHTDSLLQVMKNGRLYEAETLDEVWPEKRPLPPLWWWSQEPDAELEGRDKTETSAGR